MTHKGASSARNDIGGASQWPINKESPKSETDCIKKERTVWSESQTVRFLPKIWTTQDDHSQKGNCCAARSRLRYACLIDSGARISISPL